MRHALFVIIGAVGGIVLAYGLYALSGTAYSGRFGFVTWLTNSSEGGPIEAAVWIVLGMIVGTAASLVRRH